MEVWAAIAEFEYDGAEIQLFKEKQDAINQLYQWVGSEVIGLMSDYAKTNDAEFLNYALEMIKQIKVEKDQTDDIHWIYQEDSNCIYRIEKLLIN